MKQIIDDIHFDLIDLEKVEKKNIKVDYFLSGHLFLKTKSERLFLIKKAGSVIDSKFLEKYCESDFLIMPLNSSSSIDKIEEAFKKFLCADDELSRIKFSRQIVYDSFSLLKNYDESILGLCILFFEKLYRLPRKNLIEQYEHSSIIHQRSLIIATFSCLIALNDGITDHDCLKDLYSCAFHLDSGIYSEMDICHHVITACEKERNDSLGRAYISSFCPDKEASFFYHPIKSYEFLDAKKHFFSNPHIINIVKYHHEKADGSGFPLGYRYHGLSDIEQYLNIADNIVPFHLMSFGAGDCISFKYELNEYLKRFDNPVARDFKRQFSLNIKEVA